MKKLFGGFLLILGLVVSFNFLNVKAEDPTQATFDFNYNVIYIGEPFDVLPGFETPLSVSYGQVVTFDEGSNSRAGKEFMYYAVNNKYSPNTTQIEAGIRVTADTFVDAVFKDTGTTYVTFIDANQEMHYVFPVDEFGILQSGPSTPDPNMFSKTGLEVAGWTIDGINVVSDLATHVFTEDTVLYVKYENPEMVDIYNLTVVNGTLAEGEPLDGVYEYNQVATVTAPGNMGVDVFQYWMKDGVIASLDQTYSFTMLTDTVVEAVYEAVDTFSPLDLFISISHPYEIIPGLQSVIGQFNLPDGHEMVEYGILTSNYPGGITFDTPEVDKIRSNKYYALTNEFMMSFSSPSFNNYRAYMITNDGLTNTITYSNLMGYDFASELFISEYGEGSSNNKWIEIYNGTGSNVDMTPYSVELYGNGSATSTASYSFDLGFELAPGDTFVIANSGSVTDILNLADATSGVANFNGDDAIALLKNDLVIDTLGIIGQYGENGTGSDWADLTNHTVVRKSSITGPNDTWVTTEWDVYASDMFDYIGYHDMNYPAYLINEDDMPDTITITGPTEVNEGEFIQLDVTYPVDTLEGVIWLSSNESILTIEQDGLVSGVAEGLATVYAYSIYNHSIIDSHEITVNAIQEYTFSFDVQGGDASIIPQTILGGELATQPANPTKVDEVFEGWYTDTSFTTEYDFSTPVTEDTTIYAHWIVPQSISYALSQTDGATFNYIYAIVTGISKTYGNVYVDDYSGAITVRDTGSWYADVAVGDYVIIYNSTRSSYNGLKQLTGFTYKVMSSANTLPTAVTLTDLWPVDTSNTTSTLQSERVTSAIDYTVTSISGQNLTISDGMYSTVIRSSESSGVLYDHLQTAIVGQKVNITNIHVNWYNGPQLEILDVSEVTFIPFTDEEKVALIKSELISDYEGNEYYSNSTADLISTSETHGGTITWSASPTLIDTSTEAVSDVLTDTAVVLTATITVGTASDTQDLNVTVLAEEEPTAVYSTDLFISEYIEGSGTTRAIEIYNNTGSSVDLSAYKITNYYNGNTTVTSAYVYELSGTLNHGETFVLYHTSSVAAIITAAQTADLYFGSSSSYINFNGDDAIALSKNDVIIDLIGVIGTDPGSAWVEGDISTANMTLVRNSNVLEPTATWNSTEWTAYATDTAIYLGDHEVNLIP